MQLSRKKPLFYKGFLLLTFYTKGAMIDFRSTKKYGIGPRLKLSQLEIECLSSQQKGIASQV